MPAESDLEPTEESVLPDHEGHLFVQQVVAFGAAEKSIPLSKIALLTGGEEFTHPEASPAVFAKRQNVVDFQYSPVLHAPTAVSASKAVTLEDLITQRARVDSLRFRVQSLLPLALQFTEAILRACFTRRASGEARHIAAYQARHGEAFPLSLARAGNAAKQILVRWARAGSKLFPAKLTNTWRQAQAQTPAIAAAKLVGAPTSPLEGSVASLAG